MTEHAHSLREKRSDAVHERINQVLDAVGETYGDAYSQVLERFNAARTRYGMAYEEVTNRFGDDVSVHEQVQAEVELSAVSRELRALKEAILINICTQLGCAVEKLKEDARNLWGLAPGEKGLVKDGHGYRIRPNSAGPAMDCTCLNNDGNTYNLYGHGVREVSVTIRELVRHLVTMMES